MAVSNRIRASIENSSWVRKMFETGSALRRAHGNDAVCDFSLGNPDVEPPPEFRTILSEIAADPAEHAHAYMTNAGYPEVRRRVAEQVSKEQGVELDANHVVMSCGAAGALNTTLKTILDPGDEVLASVPYFMEYASYVDNHGGRLVPVRSKSDFDLDVDEIEKAITARTAGILLNSPNNPTGRVYPESTLRKLAEMLLAAARRTGRSIYILSDEPYRKIVYDGVTVPSILSLYPHSIVATSYSKDLSVPGERIGYVAVNPRADDAKTLVDGIVISTRVLGFVNAPALMQRVVARLQGARVDVEIYRRKRDLFCSALIRMGYELTVPQGAFYIFPRAPGGDDLAFIQALQEELILAVPGRGFGLPGWFRLAYCVDTGVIERSFDGFAKALSKFAPRGMFRSAPRPVDTGGRV